MVKVLSVHSVSGSAAGPLFRMMPAANLRPFLQWAGAAE